MKREDKEEYLVWICQKCWHLKHYNNGMAGSVLCDECWDKERHEKFLKIHKRFIQLQSEAITARDKTQ